MNGQPSKTVCEAVSKDELGTVVFLTNHDNNHNDGKDYHNILIDTHHKHLLLPSIELRIQRQRIPMYKFNIEGQPSTVTGVPVIMIITGKKC